MDIIDHISLIQNEISTVLKSIKQEQVDSFKDEILNARTIIICGAGRVGYAAKGFGMRLAHLGLNAYALGDTNVPSISKGDLLIAATGSGETQTIFDLVTIAKLNLSTIVAITGSPESRIGKLADYKVEIKAPSKTKAVEGLVSIQPMTTLNEQCLAIFFDALILTLMEDMNETHESMWARHSNLE